MATNEFGQLLRQLRLRAGYGLRRFAKLIGEKPSNLSAVETGKRVPYRSTEKLRKVANALAIDEGSTLCDKFFILAESLPSDIERILGRELNIAVLRTVDEAALPDEEMKKLVQHIRKKGRSKGNKALKNGESNR